MKYRDITINEIEQIWNIDRTEHVYSYYINDNGTLVEKVINKTFYGWPPGEDKIYTPILVECFNRNGFFYGGFENGKMKAIVVLDSKWIGLKKDTLRLKFLHVDREFRKKGIGAYLFKKSVEQARKLNAKRIYVSSCENKNTVDFYRHMGCKMTDDIDEELFALEPLDIHMEFIL